MPDRYSKVIYHRSEYSGPPSHICSVCGMRELPEADIGRTDFWLCPDCLEILKGIINSKKTCQITGIMKHHD